MKSTTSASIQRWLSQLIAAVALLASVASLTGFSAEAGKPASGASGKHVPDIFDEVTAPEAAKLPSGASGKVAAPDRAETPPDAEAVQIHYGVAELTDKDVGYEPPSGASGKIDFRADGVSVLPDFGSRSNKILLTLLFLLGVLTIGVLRGCFASARRKRLAQGDGVYIKSKCRHCGGGIEFPAHGLGEWIECPHCAGTIHLLKAGPVERLRYHLAGLWSRRPGLNWKLAAGLTSCMMVCGTALFIYLDHRSEVHHAQSVEDRRIAAEYVVQQAAERTRERVAEAEEALTNNPAYWMPLLNARRASDHYEEQEARTKRESKERIAAFDRLCAQERADIENQKKDNIAQWQLEEMQRANNIAARAASERRMREINAPKPPRRWVARYNPIMRQWEWTAQDY